MAKARKKVSAAPPNSAAEQLERYRSMRDFAVTREPSGVESGDETTAGKEALPFVIQKHAATRLHYDFRLGWNGVLKSWAVTKGPSYVPADKRLAVQVEDHPADYGGFEGIIPKGQYGGGTVMLWDRGTWEPHVDVDEGLQKGSLKFALHGQKLKGNWALVRMGGRAANASKPNWLLIKEHDEYERSPDSEPITEEAPDSVSTGRTIDEIARAEDRVWQSNRGESKTAPVASLAGNGARPSSKSVSSSIKEKRNWSRDLARAPKEALPSFISPQLASQATSPPAGKNWVHELKLDGYRMQARIDGKKSRVQLLTRTGLDWTHRMKSIGEAAREIPVDSALLDGEVVVLVPDGTTSFAKLQAAFQEGAKHKLTYFVFDLLHLNGHDTRNLSLRERKKLLTKVLSDSDASGAIRLSEDIVGDAGTIFRNACRLGAEGIISKLADSKYASGRGSSWLKLKCYQEQEFVVGGFTLLSNGTHGVGALILGYYRDGKLIYAGRTGTGFTQKTHGLLRDRLDELRRDKSPFESVPQGVSRGVIWVKPELVAQVSFSTWTADNLVRQAAFKGLREDKPAKDVQREEARADVNKAMQDEADATPPAPASTVPARRATGKDNSSDLPIRLTHPDKVLDADSGVTKKDLALYYLAVSEVMLPFIANRPLTLVRCPEGSAKQCFYQKHKTQMLGGNLDSIDIVDKKSGKPEPYITLSTSEAIVELAQISVLELHPWGSSNQSLEQPDIIVFDLDPDEAIPWETLASSALEVRKRLKDRGLQSFVKSTGGKGLHVVAPIHPEHPWPAVKQFAHDFVLAMEKDGPSLFLTKMTKAARTGKIYLDYLRNERGSTAVAPYSPRARAGLPVAMPLAWSELKSEQPPRFHVSDFSQWRKRLSRNPWKDLPSLQQHLHL
jgi:bifunctional non-homologous end joining protein LigD